MTFGEAGSVLEIVLDLLETFINLDDISFTALGSSFNNFNGDVDVFKGFDFTIVVFEGLLEIIVDLIVVVIGDLTPIMLFVDTATFLTGVIGFTILVFD